MVNGKCYIGQSVSLNKRKSAHFKKLIENKHINSHLQYAFNKYKKNAFVWKILIYCESFELTRYETFFDNYYKKLNLSYNFRECANSNKGIILSEETKKKMSRAKRGQIPWNKGKEGVYTEEIKKKMSLNHRDMSGENHPFYGKHLSEEHKKKLKESLGGKNHPFYGKHRSEETKKKISDTLKKNKKEELPLPKKE